MFYNLNLVAGHIHQHCQAAAVAAEEASESVHNHWGVLLVAAAGHSPASAAVAAGGAVHSHQVVVAGKAVVVGVVAPAAPVVVVHSLAWAAAVLDSHQLAAVLHRLQCTTNISTKQSIF